MTCTALGPSNTLVSPHADSESLLSESVMVRRYKGCRNLGVKQWWKEWSWSKMINMSKMLLDPLVKMPSSVFLWEVTRRNYNCLLLLFPPNFVHVIFVFVTIGFAKCAILFIPQQVYQYLSWTSSQSNPIPLVVGTRSTTYCYTLKRRWSNPLPNQKNAKYTMQYVQCRMQNVQCTKH